MTAAAAPLAPVPGDVGAELGETVRAALEPLLAGHARRVCIIDPPAYANVGDSVILLGQLALLRSHFPSARITYQDVYTYSARADPVIETASIILLHGGGTFGDLWPRHHALRKTILQRFPHKKIVQLSQSLHFNDPRELAETASLIETQSDFTLLTRDHTSYELASSRFACRTLLVPDMAFALSGLSREQSSVDCLCLFRTDKEGATDHAAALAAIKHTGRSVEVSDWTDDPQTARKSVDYVMRRLTRRSPSAAAALGPAMILARQAYAAERVRFGVSLLSRGKTVVTDRLHAHILCCLLGIPHLVFDSSGGKVSAFHKAWTHRYGFAQMLASLDELPDALRRLPI